MKAMKIEMDESELGLCIGALELGAKDLREGREAADRLKMSFPETAESLIDPDLYPLNMYPKLGICPPTPTPGIRGLREAGKWLGKIRPQALGRRGVIGTTSRNSLRYSDGGPGCETGSWEAP